MNQFALSRKICVSHSTLGQEHCVCELATPPVMILLETLHNHLREVHELLAAPLLPGTSIFFKLGQLNVPCTGTGRKER
jgi:hypothetical protein